MSQSIIQTFLNEHVIVIDGNDEFVLLTKAAAELEKRLRSKRQRISQAAQVAFDPAIKTTEPLVAEVQELITSKWKAFPSKCQDKPMPYIRAVILAALQKLGEEVNLAGIIWLTISNYFTFTEIAQREASVLRDFLSEVGDVYQQASWKAWQLSGKYEEVKVAEIAKISVPASKGINPEYAAKRMAAAVGASGDGANAEVFAEFSVQDRYGNSREIEIKPDADWATSFASIAGGALTVIANTLTTEVNKSLAETASLKQLAAYTELITGYLREVGESMSRQTSSHNLRSQLLWVKESMYSTGQNASYRKLPLALLPLALASDAVAMVPMVYPVSVDFFLRETLVEANTETEATCTFEQLLTELLAERATLQKTLPSHQPEAGRTSLLAFIQDLVAGACKIADFEQATGLRLADTLSRQELGVWVFRELQVLELAAAK